MNFEIIPVEKSERALHYLVNLSCDAFKATFSPYYDKGEIEAYLELAYNPAILRKELSSESSRFYFIEVDGEKAGYFKVNWDKSVTNEKYLHDFELQRLYLLPKYQKQCLGQKAMDFVLNLAQKLEKQTVWLEVWEGNKVALNFFKENNFVAVSNNAFPLGHYAQTVKVLKKDL